MVEDVDVAAGRIFNLAVKINEKVGQAYGFDREGVPRDVIDVAAHAAAAIKTDTAA